MARRQAGLCLIYGSTLALVAAPPEYRRTPQAGSRSKQFFARGLELNLGMEFATDFAGIPLNTPSHARGPGNLDTDLVISELVEGVQYGKGLYAIEQGAFAVAGSASLEVAELSGGVASFTYGGAATDRYAGLLWAERLEGPRTTYALELTRSDRPWADLAGSGRLNAALRKDGEGPLGRWSFTVLATADTSDSGGATPVRPFPQGVDFTLDDAKAGDGARNQRLLMGFRLDQPDGTRIDIYGGGHTTRRWNNWTYYLRDQTRGDQTELVDSRVFLGGKGTRSWVRQAGDLEWVHTLGAEARFDHVGEVGSYATQDRFRVGPALLSAKAELMHGAVFGRSALRWAPGWEAFLGLRLDAQVNRVTHATGDWDPQLRNLVLGSPKAGLSYSPAEGTVFALNAGQGFRLGDAFRENQPMVRARSVELSAQTRPLGPWTTSFTGWRLDLESASLFEPGLNACTGQGPARHHGLEFYNEVKGGPWKFEAALGWSRAVFKDLPAGQDRVPGSMPFTGYVGAGWERGGTSLGARLWRTGVRPLTGDNAQTARRQDELELRFQQDWSRWSVAVEVLNAFSLKTYNREYFYLSRFPDEPAQGVMGRNLKTADPQAIRLEVRRRF